MQFTISSSELSSTLQYVGKAINSKHTLPILDYFLFELNDSKLKITASDLETTQISVIEVSNSLTNGSISVPSRLITDFLKEFADQPITIETDRNTCEIIIKWETGSLSIPGLPSDGYPNVTDKDEDNIQSFSISAENLFDGISKTIFAAADKNIRPIMNGVCLDVDSQRVVFVATDAHKLVKMTLNTPTTINAQTMIILPKKPAQILRGFLAKESGDVVIEYDMKNIHFIMKDTTIICRAIDGKYPNYNSVIPTHNDNKLIVDRITLLNSIKRVAVCSNQATNLINFTLSPNKLALEAKDPEFFVSAKDALNCEYSGVDMSIGFKSIHLIDILSTLTSTNVSIELSDSTRAGLIIPVDDSKVDREIIMLLMPIMP